MAFASLFRNRTSKTPKTAFDLTSNAYQQVGNLLITKDNQVWAGYRIAEQRWNWLDDGELTSLLHASREVWASLLGDRDRLPMLERTPTRPYPVRRWAENLSARTPNPAGGSKVFNDKILTPMQRRISRAGMDAKTTVRFFQVAELKGRIDFITAMAEPKQTGVVRDVVMAEDKLARIIEAGRGWKGRRLTSKEMRWVRERSWAPGMAAPKNLRDTAMDDGEFRSETWSKRWVEDDDERFTHVTVYRDGLKLHRAVQVLSCTALAELNYPGNGLEPWMVFAERAVDTKGRPFPTEWIVSGELVSGKVLASESELALKTAMNLDKQYREFHEPPPKSIGDGIIRAKEIRDEVTEGRAVDAIRFRGSLNVVIWAEDELDSDGKVVRPAAEVVEERGQSFTDLMKGPALKMDFGVPPTQAAKLREGVPGEPRIAEAFQRQFPLDYLSTGFSNVSAIVGDNAGPYEGYTIGSVLRPVCMDSHYSTAGRGELGRKANLWLKIGSLGSGKTIGMGVGAYTDTHRGVRNVYNDPSGVQLSRLAGLLNEECGPGTAIVRNMAEPQHGELSLPTLIPLPTVEEFPSTVDLDNEMRAWQREVRALIVDVAWMLQPSDIHAILGAKSSLRDAVNAIWWTPESDLWELVDALERNSQSILKAIAGNLREWSEDRALRGIFAPRGQGGDFVIGRDSLRKEAVLTVIKTPGLRRAKEGIDRDNWTLNEFRAVPMLHLGALLTSRIAYEKPMHVPASVRMDETDGLAEYGSGRALVGRLGRDHSKHNLRVEMASQDLKGALVTDINNFIAGYYFGQMKDSNQAVELMQRVGVMDTSKAKVLKELSKTHPGEFVLVDSNNNIETMRYDLEWAPQLKPVLFSDPARDTAAWGVEEELS